jgi:hypothetical protein
MYKAKVEWVDGTTGKRYHVGDKVDLPEARLQEMIGLGMVETFVKETKIERSTFEPAETTHLEKAEKKKGK